MAELLVATAIISLLLTVSIPLFNRSLKEWQLETAAWQLATNIRLVQQMAVSGEDRHRTILFDPVNNLYRIRKDAVIISENKLPAGVTFASIAFANNRLAFTLTGAPTASGDIVLQNCYGSKYYIRVLPVTGRVKAGKTI
ncbi:MAG: hypothetical protein GX039_08170 [Clostridia bacterium]|nr:hypothetical protein [Clostridia bacterium]